MDSTIFVEHAREQMKSVGFKMIPLASCLLAIVRALLWFEVGKDSWDKWYSIPIHTLVFVFGVPGVIFLACGYLVPSRLIARFAGTEHRKRFADYIVRNATRDELRMVYPKLVQMLGDGISTPEQMQAWHDINSSCFYLIEQKSGPTKSDRRFAGFFEITSLRKKATEQVAMGRLDGAHMQAAHLTKRSSKPNTLYIGSIVGTDLTSRAYSLEQLKQEVNRIAVARRVAKVFARPVTADGLRLVRKNGFRRVGDGAKPEMGDICERIPPL